MESLTGDEIWILRAGFLVSSYPEFHVTLEFCDITLLVKTFKFKSNHSQI